MEQRTELPTTCNLLQMQKDGVHATHLARIPTPRAKANMEESEGNVATRPTTMTRHNNRNDNGYRECGPTRREPGRERAKHKIDENKGANETTTNNRLRGEPPASDMGAKMRKSTAKEKAHNMRNQSKVDTKNQ